MLQLSDDYSDPYDLRKQGAVVTAVVHEPVEVKVVPRTDTSEGDYSVPYDLKNRNKGISCNDHFFLPGVYTGTSLSCNSLEII